MSAPRVGVHANCLLLAFAERGVQVRTMNSRVAGLGFNECVVCYSLDGKLLKCRHILCDRCLPRLISLSCPYCRTPILSLPPVETPSADQQRVLLLCFFLWSVVFIGVVFNTNLYVLVDLSCFLVLGAWLFFIVVTWKNPFGRSGFEYENDVFLCLIFCLMPISCIVFISFTFKNKLS